MNAINRRRKAVVSKFKFVEQIVSYSLFNIFLKFILIYDRINRFDLCLTALILIE